VRFVNPDQPVDAQGNVLLDLAPRRPLPTLTRLVLAVDAKEFQLRKAVVHDQFENTVTMQFSRVAVNTNVPDTQFTFTPPKGVATVPMK
jgi:outer membrane lipoprotein-sorting protein